MNVKRLFKITYSAQYGRGEGYVVAETLDAAAKLAQTEWSNRTIISIEFLGFARIAE